MPENKINSDLISKNFPPVLKRFNWGAFLLNWIWGIFHKKYITLLIFPAMVIPFIGPLVISVWFGIMGNKWAWNSKDWNSIEEFNESQKFWVRLWVVLFILGIIFIAKVFVLFSIIGSVETK